MNAAGVNRARGSPLGAMGTTTCPTYARSSRLQALDRSTYTIVDVASIQQAPTILFGVFIVFDESAAVFYLDMILGSRSLDTRSRASRIKGRQLLAIGASVPLNVATLATALNPLPLSAILGAVTVAELIATPAHAQNVPTSGTTTTYVSMPTVTVQPTYTYSSTNSTVVSSTNSTVVQTSGSQISTAAGQATVRVTRTFTETLSERNDSAVKGGGTLTPSENGGAPSSVRSYAPDASLQAYFPNNVLKPGAEVFTPSYRIFATGFGGGFNDVTSLQGSFFGGLIGVDAQVMPNLIIGGAAGGSDSRSSSSAFAANSDSTGFNGSVYGIYSKNAYYAQSLTTLSSFNNDTRRVVGAFGGAPGATEVAAFGSFEVRERVELGRVLTGSDIPGLGDYKIVPFVAFEYANLHIDGHSEINVQGTGASQNLTTQGQNVTDLPTFVGARFERKYDLGNGMTLTPIVRLAYVHQFANAPVTSTFAAASSTAIFAANTTTLGRNAALTKAGFELGLSASTVVFANFDGLFSGDTSLYGGRAGVRYSF